MNIQIKKDEISFYESVFFLVIKRKEVRVGQRYVISAHLYDAKRRRNMSPYELSKIHLLLYSKLNK